MTSKLTLRVGAMVVYRNHFVWDVTLSEHYARFVIRLEHLPIPELCGVRHQQMGILVPYHCEHFHWTRISQARHGPTTSQPCLLATVLQEAPEIQLGSLTRPRAALAAETHCHPGAPVEK